MFCGIRNDKMVKKANWTTRFKYNIICLHPSCKTFSGWNTRMNMASFNKHYGNVHKIKGQGAVRQGQVVSHWAITKDFYGNIKRVQEYRLIDVKSLEFIDDTDPTVADVDIQLIQNNKAEMASANILIKTEVGYEIFSRAEPDVLYPRLLRLLYRVSS
eukprot:137287_1